MTEKDEKKQDISSTPRSAFRVPRSNGSEFDRQKILIVDDRKENLVALRQVLRDLDVDIFAAVSGNEALAATLDHRFAVAILDVMMPGMDGYELAEHLRGDTKTRNVPIIFLTAVYSEEERIFKGYEVGAVDYIVKPYNPEVMRSKVRVFLELDRTHQELAEKIVALTASEERYRSLVTTIPDIVYRIDADGRFTYLNDAVNTLGYTQEELLGSHFSKILVPADVDKGSRELVLPGYRGIITGMEGAPKLFDERRTGKRKTVGLEVRLVPRKGDRTVPAELHSGLPGIVIVEINSSGVYAGAPDGKKTVFLGTVGVIRDITERKRAEEELAKHRDKLKDLVRERVKEQACLYNISEVLTGPHKTLDDALGRTVNLIPSGWQYPDIACARLCLDDRTVTSEPFHESRWRLDHDIAVGGQRRGAVEVFYMEERPSADQGPFIKEEKDLINNIAGQLGDMIRREEALEKLRESEANLRKFVRELDIRNRIKEVFITETGEDMYAKVLDILLDAMKSRFGVFGYMAEDGALVVPSMTREIWEKCKVPDKNIVFPKDTWGHSAWPRAIREKKGNFSNEPSTLIPEGHIGIDRSITMPILYQEEVIGLIQFANRESEYTTEDLAVLKDISKAVAPLLNARLQHERQDRIIRESENRYRAIFEGAAEGIVVADIETRRVKYANPAMCRMLGYTSEELIRLSLSDMHPPESVDDVIASFEAKAKGEKLVSQDTPCLRKDNSVILTDITTNPVIIDGRRCNVAFFLDVTESKRLEEQLIQSQKMESIGMLTGGIAHDFNNLLTTIIGNAEMALMDVAKEEDLHEVIEEIKEAGSKAASLTHQLLAFSRKQILQLEVINLNDVIFEVEKMLKRIIGEDIELKMIPSPDPALVKADPVQFDQIIMNLAVNARDAMPKGGKLTIEIKNMELDEEYARAHIAVEPGPYVMLAMSDTGIGMTKEVQSRIFEPFFTTKVMGKGTGLGLSTVYGIVKQSNGNIWVYSEPGKGATFKIYLPGAKEETAVALNRAEIREEALQGSQTVLVVEDEEMVRNTAFRALKRHGYTVLCAHEGQEALRICRTYEEPIHLMLTDVVMPGIGGRDLAEQVQGLRPDLKVLYMSGYTDDAIVEHGVLEKGIAFLQKPFTPDGLALKVKEVLEG